MQGLWEKAQDQTWQTAGGFLAKYEGGDDKSPEVRVNNKPIGCYMINLFYKRKDPD